MGAIDKQVGPNRNGTKSTTLVSGPRMEWNAWERTVFVGVVGTYGALSNFLACCPRARVSSIISAPLSLYRGQARRESQMIVGERGREREREREDDNRQLSKDKQMRLRYRRAYIPICQHDTHMSQSANYDDNLSKARTTHVSVRGVYLIGCLKLLIEGREKIFV